ncbi:MAG: hypothetical protein ACQCN6_10985 [Candidatus Bathyarchaeia archaeon]|jgi:hypothetical protein
MGGIKSKIVHAQLNIDLCRACGEKTYLPHRTDAETQCFSKKQPHSQPVLWHPADYHTHIKRQNSPNA